MSRLASTGGPFRFRFEPPSSWVATDKPLAALGTVASTAADTPAQPLKPGDTLNLLTWNIDFATSFSAQRARAALRHMQERLSEPPYSSSTGTVILLQEVADLGVGGGFFRDSSALAAILADEWARRGFLTASTTMPQTYGTVTLISKNLATVPAQRDTDIQNNSPRGCFRVPAPASVMGRDLLCIDIILQGSGILRICNAHLESLAMGTKTRPLQLALASQLLREEGVAAGIVAGDMNAIETPDFTLSSREDIQLRDVWAEYIGKETALAADSENIGRKEKSSENDGKEGNWGEGKGHTWGYQSGRTSFHPRRLDKILFRVNKGAKVWLEPVEGAKVDRLGMLLDVKIDSEQYLKEGSIPEENYYEGSISGEEEDEYLKVSDHFGLMTRFIVVTGQGRGESAPLQ